MAIQVRFTDTSMLELDTNSKHSIVMLNVAESSFLEICKFIAVGWKQLWVLKNVSSVHTSNWNILKKVTCGTGFPPEPGGLYTFWSLIKNSATVSIQLVGQSASHPGGSNTNSKLNMVKFMNGKKSKYQTK